MPLTSDAANENAIAQHSTDPFLIRLTIEHEEYGDPILIVRNRKSITTTDGREFIPYPFSIRPPNDDNEQPSADIVVANVDREIGRKLESIITPAVFTIEIFLASTPDTVERTWGDMSMTSAQWDFKQVTMTIQRLGFWDEPISRKRIMPQNFPGMFP